MNLTSLDVTLHRIQTIESQFQSLMSYGSTQKPSDDFQKILDTDTDILYRFKKRLMGDLIIHNILFAKISKLIFSYGTDIDQTCAIGIPELQAINEKVKELGWNE